MKRNLLIVFVMFQAFSFAQKPDFIIKGKVGHLNSPAQAELVYTVNDKNIRDTSTITHGEFSFKGTVPVPAEGTIQGIIIFHHLGAGLSYKTKGNLENMKLFIEPGVITVTGDDSLKNASISGSKANDDYKVYTRLIKPVTDSKLSINTAYKRANPKLRATKSFTDSLETINLKANELQKQILLKYIHDYPDSWMCFDALKAMGGTHPDVSYLEPLFNSFSDHLKHSGTGQAFISTLENIKNVKIGFVAPAFTLNDQNGKPVSLSDFKGKYLLLDFWASWCAPCRAENPNVVKAYNLYKDKNFTILSVSIDEEIFKSAWLKAIIKDNLPWTQVRDDEKSKSMVRKLYGIKGIPDNFLISPDGKILARTLRGVNLTDKLAEILK